MHCWILLRRAGRNWRRCARWIPITCGRDDPMNNSKLTTMQEAMARNVPSGSMIVLGTQLAQMIPFAAGHELIRQGKRDLTLVGPASDILFDQMIGAGCVSRGMASWIGNLTGGVGDCYRRAVERQIPQRLD